MFVCILFSEGYHFHCTQSHVQILKYLILATYLRVLQVVEIILKSLGTTLPALYPLCTHILASKEGKTPIFDFYCLGSII